MTDIIFKLVDGEPICTQEGCPSFGKSGWEQVQPSTCSQPDSSPFGTCVPGLRQQRDEARREICEDHEVPMASAEGYAEARGWSNLYKE